MTATVQGYLDAALGAMRVRELELLADEFTSRPLADTVKDMRSVLESGIDLGGYHRLNILISHLYHRCGADIPLTTALRAEANAALRRGPAHDRGEVNPCPARTLTAAAAAALPSPARLTISPTPSAEPEHQRADPEPPMPRVGLPRG